MRRETKIFIYPFLFSTFTILVLFGIFSTIDYIRNIDGGSFYIEYEFLILCETSVLVFSLPNLFILVTQKLSIIRKKALLINSVYFLGWVSYIAYFLVIYYVAVDVDSLEFTIWDVLFFYFLLLLTAMPILLTHIFFKEGNSSKQSGA